MYSPTLMRSKPNLRLATRHLTGRTLFIAFFSLVSITFIHLLFPLHPQRPYLIPSRSFVALSVDDFGRWADSIPLFPNTTYLDHHPNLQIANKDFWYSRATVETKDDLTNLLAFFRNLNRNVSFEQRATLTPHFVVGGPHFDEMRRAGCGVPTDDDSTEANFDKCVYRESLITEPGPTGLDQAPYHRGDLKDAYRELFLEGMWHPEYHGRSHFGVSKWLSLLRTDKKAQACFKENLVCATDVTQLRSEFNSFSSKAQLRKWVEDGVLVFTSFWGYRPSLISSPHNTWNNWLAEVVDDLSFVGAELAEDQASYVSRADDLSLHDRYRFDVFFPGFECDTAIEEVEDLLNARERQPRNKWHAFLSRSDVFRSYRKAFSQGGPAGVHERFVSLMWHAQNSMSSTYSKEELNSYMGCVERVVRHVRDTVPEAVFVTGAELHQIRVRGWSVETWHDGLVLRNYLTKPVEVRVPNIRDIYAGGKWDKKDMIVKQIAGKNAGGEDMKTSIGGTLRLEPDSVYHLTR